MSQTSCVPTASVTTETGLTPTLPSVTSKQIQQQPSRTAVVALSPSTEIQSSLLRLTFSKEPADRELMQIVEKALHGYGCIRLVDGIGDGKSSVTGTISPNSTGGYDILIDRRALSTNSGSVSSADLAAVLSDEITHIQARRTGESTLIPILHSQAALSQVYAEEAYSKIHQTLYVLARSTHKTMAELTLDDINRSGGVTLPATFSPDESPMPLLTNQLPDGVAPGSVAASLLGNLARYHDRVLGSTEYNPDAVANAVSPKSRLLAYGIAPKVLDRIDELFRLSCDTRVSAELFDEYYRSLAIPTPPRHAIVQALDTGPAYPDALASGRSISRLEKVASSTTRSGYIDIRDMTSTPSIREISVPAATKFAATLKERGIVTGDASVPIWLTPESLPSEYRQSPFYFELLSVADPLSSQPRTYNLLLVKSSSPELPPLFVGTLSDSPRGKTVLYPSENFRKT